MSQMRAGLVGIVAGTEQVILQMTKNFVHMKVNNTFPSELLVGRREGRPACKITGCWFVGGDLTGALRDL